MGTARKAPRAKEKTWSLSSVPQGTNQHQTWPVGPCCGLKREGKGGQGTGSREESGEREGKEKERKEGLRDKG